MAGISLGQAISRFFGRITSTKDRSGTSLPYAQSEKGLVDGKITLPASTMSGRASPILLFTLPPGATLLLFQLQTLTAFDVTFNMRGVLTDGTVMTSLLVSAPFTNVSDQFSLFRPYTYSNSVAVGCGVQFIGGSTFPTLTSGALRVLYLYINPA